MCKRLERTISRLYVLENDCLKVGKQEFVNERFPHCINNETLDFTNVPEDVGIRAPDFALDMEVGQYTLSGTLSVSPYSWCWRIIRRIDYRDVDAIL